MQSSSWSSRPGSARGLLPGRLIPGSFQRNRTQHGTRVLGCLGGGRGREGLFSLSLRSCCLPPSVTCPVGSLFPGHLRFSDRVCLPLYSPLSSYLCSFLFPLSWSLHCFSPAPALSVPSASPLGLFLSPLVRLSFASAARLIVPTSQSLSVSTGCEWLPGGRFSLGLLLPQNAGASGSLLTKAWAGGSPGCSSRGTLRNSCCV